MYWLIAAAFLLALVILAYRVGLRAAAGPGRARADFLARRAELEDEFFRAASASGKPRGLRWKAIDWGTAVEMAREKATRTLTALVEITVHFEAVEGGEMEGVEAVSLPRNASAVFFHQGGAWRTQGKAVFNMGPAEALAHFANQYEHLPGGQSDSENG